MRSPSGKGVVAVLVMVLVLAAASVAHAALGCVDLGGTVVGSECRITSPQNKSGAYEIGGVSTPLKLHFVDGGAPNSVGKVTTDGADLSIIVHGDFLMDSNTLIDANKSGCFTGGAITLTADGDVIAKPLSTIRSNSCSGGEIIIRSGANHSTAIEGLVESVGSISGTGAKQRPGGGPITIESLCNLTIALDGRVSSRGGDPGGDLVRLVGGCVVSIFGLVESTGVGHGAPNNPANHCSGALRPDKPPKSTACVEIVAGDQLVIDSKLPNNGEVRADTGGPGGSRGTSWIDAFVRGSILITGDVNLPFSVHANGLAGTNDNGGTITFKSKTSTITASGFAFQADATNPGGDGGTIVVEAAQAINLNDAQLLARGDFSSPGGFGFGGHVVVHSFKGGLTWQDTVVTPVATGDVRPTGSALPLSKRGTIDLSACGAVSTTNTVFPVNGAVVAPFPNVTAGLCPPAPNDSPSIPAYAGVTELLPACQCLLACICTTGFSPASVGTGAMLTIAGNGLASVSKVVLSPSCDPLHPGAAQATILSQSGQGCNIGTVQALVPGAPGGNYFVIVTATNGASSCTAGLLTKQ